MTSNKNLVPRRDFIKTSALGLSALSIGLPLNSALATSCGSSGKDKLGIALVGLGNYSKGQLAPSLLETEHCYLSAIVTGTKEKEKEWAEKYNIPKGNIYNYENFDDIASNKDIDIVYIVLPNSMHAEFTIRAAKAGKHVICEKPMAVSAAECKAMIKACNDNNVKLSIGYRLQFDPYHKRIINLSKENTLGSINYVNADFAFTIGDPTQWRLKKDLAGGGALMDVGVYCIQACRYSFGQEPIALRAQAFNSGNEKFKEVNETITWQMEFPDGKISNSTTSYAMSVNSLFVSAQKGKAQLMPSYGYGGIEGFIKDEILEFPKFNQQAAQMDTFALNVKNNTESIVPGEEGLKDMKVIEAIFKSLEQNGARILI
ncbi:Gfo/Idh/MocA family protein [Seonamhaeicola maritimus]|uniref:Gfo/Idh/MocA family protein n=1 Tax=Seonamhaeicola maritimus TaxID=2591822 RepID=UPI00249591C7|nr:Gfo/Idh/MocA family oxidoreductase [Seonamhaeicola maritimus]